MYTGIRQKFGRTANGGPAPVTGRHGCGPLFSGGWITFYSPLVSIRIASTSEVTPRRVEGGSSNRTEHRRAAEKAGVESRLAAIRQAWAAFCAANSLHWHKTRSACFGSGLGLTAVQPYVLCDDWGCPQTQSGSLAMLDSSGAYQGQDNVYMNARLLLSEEAQS